MRVLVTGGAGFIGSHIVEQLIAAGHEPFVVDNLSTGRRENLPADVPLFAVDTCDSKELGKVFDEVRPEWVCQQAAQMSVSLSVREPAFDARVNILGLLNVLDHSVRVGAERVVFASSGGVLYGDVFEPADETHAAAPISPYGISKWVGEKYLEFYARQHGIKTVALRYANVFGPRQNPDGEAGVVAIFSQKMLAGTAPLIFGDGSHVRDYVYAGDVAHANLKSMEAELSENFIALNIGTSTPTTVNELAGLIRTSCQAGWERAGKAGDVPAAQHAEPRAGDLNSSLVSSALAEKILDWKPQTTLAEGLAATVGWFAQQISLGTA